MDIWGYEHLHVDEYISLDDIFAEKNYFPTPLEAILFLCLSKTTLSFFEADFFTTSSEKMLAKTYATPLKKFFKDYKELEVVDDAEIKTKKSEMLLPMFWEYLFNAKNPTMKDKAFFIREFIEKVSPSNKSLNEMALFVEDLVLGRAILVAHDEADKSVYANFNWKEVEDFYEKNSLFSLDEMSNVSYVMQDHILTSLAFKKLPETKQQMMDAFSHPAAAMWFNNIKDEFHYSLIKQKQLENYPVHTQKVIYYLLNDFLFNCIPLVNQINTMDVEKLLESTMDISPKINRQFYISFFKDFENIIDHPLYYFAYNFDDLATDFEDFYFATIEEIGLDFDFFEELIANRYAGYPHHEILNPFMKISWEDFFEYEEILGNKVPDEEATESNVVIFKKKNNI